MGFVVVVSIYIINIHYITFIVYVAFICRKMFFFKILKSKVYIARKPSPT